MIGLKERFEDTVFAPATVPGSGAISVVRVSGPDALAVADRVLGGAVGDAPGYSIRYAVVRMPDGGVLDEVLVSVFRAPHSYTGEDSVEISCHASRFVVEQLMMLLGQAGARAAAAGEFTRRAFVNGKLDLAQAEAVADLIAAEGAAAHRVAVNQLRGGFSKELAGMRGDLLRMVSLLELELDFSDEEVEFADRGELAALAAGVRDHAGRLAESFRLGNVVKNGVPVAIVGATNAGKSTLLNALLGEQRAIVSDVHGTTRDTVEECLNLDGTLFRLIDTAGIREGAGRVERIGIGRTFEKLASAEVVLLVMDVASPLRRLVRSLEEVLGRVDLSRQKLMLVMNKADVFASGDEGGFSPALTQVLADVYEGFQELLPQGVRIVRDVPVIALSAKYSFGLDDLRGALVSHYESLAGASEGTLVTNVRHVEALVAARDALDRACRGLSEGIPSDLVAQDVREAVYHLGDIVGEISGEEVLGEIFGRFCIGK